MAWVWERGIRGRSARWLALGVGGLVLLAAFLTVRAWSGLPGSASGPAGAITYWLSGVEFELHKLQLASGWIQDIFGRTPDWAHVPLATLYGMVQPFLPAALMDNSGVVLMRGVMVFARVGLVRRPSDLALRVLDGAAADGMAKPGHFSDRCGAALGAADLVSFCRRSMGQPSLPGGALARRGGPVRVGMGSGSRASGLLVGVVLHADRSRSGGHELVVRRPVLPYPAPEPVPDLRARRSIRGGAVRRGAVVRQETSIILTAVGAAV